MTNIQYTNNPASADIEFLTQQINDATPGFGTAHPFAFFIRNDLGEMIAGCNGYVVFGAIYTDQLWVHPDYRGAGLGRKLMECVYDHGRKEGCTMATVSTMSFQAPEFYLKLGFTVEFVRNGYNNDASSYCLKRDL